MILPVIVPDAATDEGVIAPSVKVIAGVVVDVAYLFDNCACGGQALLFEAAPARNYPYKIQVQGALWLWPLHSQCSP